MQKKKGGKKGRLRRKEGKCKNGEKLQEIKQGRENFFFFLFYLFFAFAFHLKKKSVVFYFLSKWKFLNSQTRKKITTGKNHEKCFVLT